MGGRGDSWAKAIAHRERDKVVIDLACAWPPSVGVHDIAKESADIGKRYGCKSTVGDNYAGEWPKEAFAEHGVAYERCELAKSDLYLAAIPLMSSKRVELLDNDRMVKEFRRLERKPGRGGKDAVQDGGRHDDLANAIAGVINVIMSKPMMSQKAIPIGVGRGIGADLAKLDSSFGKPLFGTPDGRLSQGIPVRVGYDDDDDVPDRRGGSWIIRSPFTPDDHD
jgi:hypothetical protein